MNLSPILNVSDCEKIIHSRQDVRVIDCRFNLAEPDWGFSDYQRGHIPGALYAHLNNDLSAEVTEHSGRHPLPSIGSFTQTLARWGIRPSTHVVVYDTNGGAYAARLWFMLRAIGHSQVQLLDGGFQAWRAAGLPIQSGVEIAAPVERYSQEDVRFNPQFLATGEEIESAVDSQSFVLIDARAPERFLGVQEPIDTAAGHIPGAVNRFHSLNLTQAGVFKSPDTLLAEFKSLLGSKNAEQAIVYCGSGVTSCHHLLAMEMAGIKGARLYAGSWSEWIRDPQHPIATGSR